MDRKSDKWPDEISVSHHLLQKKYTFTHTHTHSHLVLWSPWNIQEQNTLSLSFGPLVPMKNTRAKYPITLIWSSGLHEIYKSKISCHSHLVRGSRWNIQEQNILSVQFGPLVPMEYIIAEYPVTLIWSFGLHKIDKTKIYSHSHLVLWSPWNREEQMFMLNTFLIWFSSTHKIDRSNCHFNSDLVLWSL
jgi:hypothetical protein